MKKILLSFLAIAAISTAKSQIYLYEGFDDVSSLVDMGWTIENHSAPVGATSWIQGDPLSFGNPAWSGAEDAFVEAAFTSTGDLGTISDWLVTPVVNLSDGDSVRFYALAFNSTAFPDRLEVRLSTDGASSTLPSNETGVGSFTTLLLSINPDLNTTDFPSVVDGENYHWYHIAISGIGTNVSSKIAFRYFVTDAGATGANSSQVGIDEFYVTGPAGFTGIDENAANATIKVYPNPASNDLTVQLSDGMTGQVSILDMSGRVAMSINANSSINRFNVADLAEGIYTIQVTSRDGKVQTQRFMKN